MKDAACGVAMPPTNGTDPGDQSGPVRKQNKDENCGKKPKRFLHQIAANDAFEKIVETFHQPFPEILGTARNRLNVTGRHLGEKDDADRDNP